ncbi:MAG: hypothetical protein HRU26_07740, partial [Psychroserpens sp.]|nr:hypothetical protein [Psychroserpens sp.]
VELMCSADGVWSGNVEFQSTVDNNNFRFFTILDDWASGRNYPWFVDAGYTIDANLVDAMDGDNNFAFVGTDGTYFLTIDSNNLEITLGPPQGDGSAACEFDQLYGVGAGLTDTGWDWGNPAVFSCVADGIYSGTVNLQSTADNNNFRFFTVLDDWASGRNYPFYADAGYTIDSNLVNAMDGDLNFAFVGTDGEYTVTIDTNNLTISLTAGEASCEFDQLYGVGAGLVDTGWDWGNPAVFTCTSNGVYSGTVALQSGDGTNNFRFFTILDDWASGRNYPFYTDAGYTIDSDLVDAMDDDNNFAFVGTDGTYTITIDTNNLTISVD